MANTYTQLLIQYVFAVKHREALIAEDLRIPLEKYISGIKANKQHKMLAIFCMPDHCHLLVGLHPSQSISDPTKDIKANSAKWINDNKYTHIQFNWQEGYGAFSYSKSQLNAVVNYILNQPNHHSKKTFRAEYFKYSTEIQC